MITNALIALTEQSNRFVPGVCRFESYWGLTKGIIMTYLRILERLAQAEDIQAEWQQIVPDQGREEIVQSIYEWMRNNCRFMWSARHDGGTERWFVPKINSSIGKKEAIKLFKFLFIPKQVIKVYHWEY